MVVYCCMCVSYSLVVNLLTYFLYSETGSDNFATDFRLVRLLDRFRHVDGHLLRGTVHWKCCKNDAVFELIIPTRVCLSSIFLFLEPFVKATRARLAIRTESCLKLILSLRPRNWRFLLLWKNVIVTRWIRLGVFFVTKRQENYKHVAEKRNRK